MYGSVELFQNYVRIRPTLHVMVHAALCFFFPSYLPLQYALARTSRVSNQPQEAEDAVALLSNEGKIAEIGIARERAAQGVSENMKGNQHAKKPPSSDPDIQQRRESKLRREERNKLLAEGKPVPDDLQKRPRGGNKCTFIENPTKKVETNRLKKQRRILNREKENNFFGSYTSEEIRMYNAKNPEHTLKHYKP